MCFILHYPYWVVCGLEQKQLLSNFSTILIITALYASNLPMSYGQKQVLRSEFPAGKMVKSAAHTIVPTDKLKVNIPLLFTGKSI